MAGVDGAAEDHGIVVLNGVDGLGRDGVDGKVVVGQRVADDAGDFGRRSVPGSCGYQDSRPVTGAVHRVPPSGLGLLGRERCVYESSVRLAAAATAECPKPAGTSVTRGRAAALEQRHQAADGDAYLRLAGDLEGFLARLRDSAATAPTGDRPRVLRTSTGTSSSDQTNWRSVNGESHDGITTTGQCP